MAHTPGPWTICPIDAGTATNANFTACLSVAGPITTIARVTEFSHHHASSEQIANARLIAAAPDMLAALKECLELADDGCYCAMCTSIRQWVKPVIAKAEGR